MAYSKKNPPNPPLNRCIDCGCPIPISRTRQLCKDCDVQKSSDSFDRAWALVKAKCSICGKTHYDGDEMCANCSNLDDELRGSGAFRNFMMPTRNYDRAWHRDRMMPNLPRPRPHHGQTRIRNEIENRRYLDEMTSPIPSAEPGRYVIACPRCGRFDETRSQNHSRYCCGRRMMTFHTRGEDGSVRHGPPRENHTPMSRENMTSRLEDILDDVDLGGL